MCLSNCKKRYFDGSIIQSYENFEFTVNYTYQDCPLYNINECDDCGLFIGLQDFKNWEELVSTVLKQNDFPTVERSNFLNDEITNVYLNCIDAVKKELAAQNVKLF